MRNLVASVTLISATFVAVSAPAADLPTKKAPPFVPPPPPLWTGFYGGLNVGGMFGDSTVRASGSDLFDDGAGASTFGVPTFFGLASAMAATSSSTLNSSGVIGGGQIGYNFQFANNVVAGAEADIQGATLSQTSTVWGIAQERTTGIPFLSASTISRKLDYLGTVRGRLGYLVTPTLLLYGTGGLAWANLGLGNSLFQFALDPTGTVGPSQVSGAFNDTRAGWAAGGGVEWLFLPNWSAKLEYLHYDLGNVNAYVGAVGFDPVGNRLYSTAVNIVSRFQGHIVRVGLNYHFNWNAPSRIVAKY